MPPNSPADRENTGKEPLTRGMYVKHSLFGLLIGLSLALGPGPLKTEAHACPFSFLSRTPPTSRENRILSIQPVRPGDFAAFKEILSHPRVEEVSYNGMTEAFIEAEFQRLQAQRDRPDWEDRAYGIYHRRDDRLIGLLRVGRDPENPREGEVAIALHPDFWGAGHGPAAGILFGDHLFSDLGFETIHASAAAGNRASNRVIQWLGFEKVSESRSVRGGRPVLGYHYRIHRDQWKQKARSLPRRLRGYRARPTRWWHWIR